MKSNSQRLRNLLIQYFQAIASGQNSFQCIKQAIFLQQNFNPLKLFDMIAKGTQFQTFQNWKRYLIDCSISFEQQELVQFFKHENFEKRISFNSFLEAIMPYSPEVLRDYKKRYLTSLQIQILDSQCQIMFRELMKFSISFFKSLIKIKNQIKSLASISEVISLVKQDLINKSIEKSSIRKAVKFKQTFGTPNYQIGYHQLRRFLQFFIEYKKGNIQNDLLQITRFFKGENPFLHLDERILKKSRTRSKSSSPTKQRSKSNQRLKSKANIINKPSGQGLSQNKKDYINYRHQLYKQMQSYKQNTITKFKSDEKPTKSSNYQNEYNEIWTEQKKLRDIRYKRDSKSIKGHYIVSIFQEIVTKQKVIERLRKQLANDNTFNLINLYKLIDYNNRGYLNSKTIQQFIGVNNVDCKLLVRYYSRQKQKLRFQDFCMIYRPLSKKLNDLLDQRPEHKVPNPFKKDTMKSIIEVLTLSSELFNSINTVRQSINDNGVNLKHLFQYIDLDDKGYIEAADIKDLLNQKDVACESKDLKCLMKIFKKRLQQKITFEDFQQFVDL